MLFCIFIQSNSMLLISYVHEIVGTEDCLSLFWDPAGSWPAEEETEEETCSCEETEKGCKNIKGLNSFDFMNMAAYKDSFRSPEDSALFSSYFDIETPPPRRITPIA